jgi:hypothetical protein
MANDEHVALLKQGVAAWNAWRAENPNIRPDLRGAVLNRTDLRGADLSEADLEEAALKGGEPQRGEPPQGSYRVFKRAESPRCSISGRGASRGGPATGRSASISAEF